MFLSQEKTRDPMDERRPPPSLPANPRRRSPRLTRFVMTAAQMKAIKGAFKAGVPMTRLARRFGVAT